MTVKTFALIAGIVYLALGMLGFVPQLLTPVGDAPPLRLAAYHGYLLGLFPVNFMDNLAHLAVGAWGIAAARSVGGAKAYSKTMATLLAVLTVLGLMPATNTLFGLIPIYGMDVWLHAGTAVAAAFCGWVLKGLCYIHPGDDT